jgi:AcrR family transcriptional regulator
MERKEIQEQRMRGYFIDATKQLLRAEGLRSVNVRAIAEKAGYSYATLYNYFRDAKDLVFECVKDFQDECVEFVDKETSRERTRGIGKIKMRVRAYMKFFVQYPGIFDLFFLERMSDIRNKQPTVELICSFLDRICGDEWAYCVAEGILTRQDAEEAQDELRAAVGGLLLFYLNRGRPETYREFTALSAGILDRILDRTHRG